MYRTSRFAVLRDVPEGGLFTDTPNTFFARIASAPQPFLSYCEEFLWWSARLAGDTTFNVRVVLRLKGALDVSALEASIIEIARRHETLRTAFPMEAEIVRRRLLPPEVARPAVIDLEPVDAATREDEAWRRVLEEANQTFNLLRGPLFRAKIFRLGPDNHLLQLTVHHLVIDGGSVDILLRELGILYAAYRRRERSPLADLPVQYAEYAQRGRERLDGARRERTLAYWKAQLAGIPSLLELPRDGPRRAARHYRGHTLTFALDAERTAAIGRLAREHRTTTFVFLLGLFQLLLYRLSGNPAVAIEAPLGSRRSVEAEGLIGLLVDLVPLRSDLAGNPRLAELLSSVRRATFGALDHAGVPIHVLVDALDVRVDASHSAMCQVMFNLIDRRARAAYLDSLQAELVPLPESPHSKFDMMLTAHLTDVLAFQLLYRRDLFSEARMQEVVRQYTLLIDQALAAPEARVETYSLVTAEAALTLAHVAPWQTLAMPPGTRVAVLPGTANTAIARAALAELSPGAVVSYAPGGATPLDVEQWLDAATAIVGDVAAWRRLRKCTRLGSLRKAFFIGGVLLREDIDRVRTVAPGVECTYLFGCEDHPEYLACCEIPAETRALRTIVPVGRGFSNVALDVLNRHGELAGIGEVGELHFRLRDPGAALLRPMADGRRPTATGLLGQFLPDGSIDRIGSEADWGTVNGYTVRFGEVVSALLRHPDVLDATVAIDGRGGDAQLVASVVPDGDRWSAADIEELLSDHLPGYMIPGRLVRVRERTE